MGFCYICLCDVREDELRALPCGHSVCLGNCGQRLPTPYCPSGGCNKRINEVFVKHESKPQAELKRRGNDESIDDRIRELRARGFVAAPAPPVLLTDPPIQNPYVLPVVPDIIVIDDDEVKNDEEEEVVFIECRKA